MIAIILSLLAALSWGLAPLFDKKSLQIEKNIMNQIVIRSIFIGLIGLIGFIVISSLTDKIAYNDDTKKSSIYIFISVLFIVLGSYFYLTAIKYSNNVTLVILLTHILPIIIVALLSVYLFREKLNKEMVVGLLITFIGISIFTYYSQ